MSRPDDGIAEPRAVPSLEDIKGCVRSNQTMKTRALMRLAAVLSVVCSLVAASPAHAQQLPAGWSPTVTNCADTEGGLDSLSFQEQQALGCLLSLLPPDQQTMVL